MRVPIIKTLIKVRIRRMYQGTSLSVCLSVVSIAKMAAACSRLNLFSPHVVSSFLQGTHFQGLRLSFAVSISPSMQMLSLIRSHVQPFFGWDVAIPLHISPSSTSRVGFFAFCQLASLWQLRLDSNTHGLSFFHCTNALRHGIVVSLFARSCLVRHAAVHAFAEVCCHVSCLLGVTFCLCKHVC